MKVELIDHHGSDLLVVNAARASFGKESKWETEELLTSSGTATAKFLSAKDTRLIRFLAREKHLLPFRHPQITLRLKVPIFVARQLGKHQTGMSWSEESRRYIDAVPEFYWPETWRKRAENVKQGSSDEDLTNEYIKGAAYTVNEAALGALNQARRAYQELLDNDVAPELARMILPQNMYTTCVWTGSLLSFVHVIHERTTAGTQKETRDVALQIKDILTPLYPVSTQALLYDTHV